ncbi:hypothetical protein PPL_08192 [Heterostelium album PN500]|uniref:Protein kinase domain-containing protein n=1 Tax=Heterostelium pallidum (strain ATCC 26659 / Pp 5 / PN500) TaxID=670386 RepID=D3BIV7_HETP5|nr:hypothetical protein PPL_08192 [Heterostelium album PN500]EFA78731.1 hypothetical protein PPL_08192 [Heterostelium album PN500]|eukprot:XP_020430855.1 hypothetical protein PPL_08192 [Heterostelium album PN500]
MIQSNNNQYTTSESDSQDLELKFDNDYNETVHQGSIQEELVGSLTFGKCFDCPILPGALPPTLKSLRFGANYNQEIIEGVLPETLESLKFGDSFNKPIMLGVLPQSLRSIIFGKNFNQPIEIGSLPERLEYLEFYDDFNQLLLPGCLPSSLKTLIFYWHFNQPIHVNVLPEKLDSLTLGPDYNLPIEKDVLPKSLRVLNFGLYYNLPILPGILPNSITELRFDWFFNQPIYELPSCLEVLRLERDYNIPLPVLPPTLKSLSLGTEFAQVIEPGILPESLTNLSFSDKYNYPILPGTLPKSLIKLYFGHYFNQALGPGLLPASLEILALGAEYSHPIVPGVFPPSLYILNFNTKTDIPKGVLPQSLKTLVYSSTFPIISGSLPESVESIEFGFQYNHPIKIGDLPNRLKSLKFNDNYMQTIHFDTLPSSLKSFNIGKNTYQVDSSSRGEILSRPIECSIKSYAAESFLNIELHFKNITSHILVVIVTFGNELLVEQVGENTNHELKLTGLNINNHDINMVILKNNDKWILKRLQILATKSAYHVITINSVNNYISNFQPDLFFNEKTFIINSKLYYYITKFSQSLNEVYLVISKDTNMLCAYKINKYEDRPPSYYSRLANEVITMTLLSGKPNFVQMVDSFDDVENKIYHILTEYCIGGDLNKLFRIKSESKEKYFSEPEIWNYISQLFYILKELEHIGVIHCDIKPMNIFIKNGNLVLGDFGCSTFNDNSKEFKTIDWASVLAVKDKPCLEAEPESLPSVCDIEEPNSIANVTRGTKGYIAPEAIFKYYSHSFDIYSVGSTILKLLSCHEKDINNHIQFISDRNNIIISSQRYSKQLIDFVTRMLDKQPQNRESFQTILDQHVDFQQTSIKYNIDAPFHTSSTLISEICFGSNFNQTIEPITIPFSVTSVTLLSYKKPLLIGALPSTLKSLILEENIHHPLPGVLPSSLEILRIDSGPIVYSYFPKTLKVLTLGSLFNFPLHKDMLPQSLQSLEFGYSFDQPMEDGVLPNKLQSLKLGFSFKSHLILPSSLEYIEFNNNYQIDDGLLPDTITHIVGLNCPLKPGLLPKCLEILEFGYSFNQELEQAVLPESLKSLRAMGQVVILISGRNNEDELFESILQLNYFNSKKKCLPGSYEVDFEYTYSFKSHPDVEDTYQAISFDSYEFFVLAKYINSNEWDDTKSYLVQSKQDFKLYVYETTNYLEANNQNCLLRLRNECRAITKFHKVPRFIQHILLIDDTEAGTMHLFKEYYVGRNLEYLIESRALKYVLFETKLTSNIKLTFFQLWRNEHIKEEEIRHIIPQIFDILALLEAHGVTHADINISNLYIKGQGLVLDGFKNCSFLEDIPQAENIKFDHSYAIYSFSLVLCKLMSFDIDSEGIHKSKHYYSDQLVNFVQLMFQKYQEMNYNSFLIEWKGISS